MAEILKRLKNETQEWHSRIETLIPVFSKTFTRSEYGQLLARFYGFYLPYEATASDVPGLRRLLPDWPERLKSPAIVNDLRWLGSTDGDLILLPR